MLEIISSFPAGEASIPYIYDWFEKEIAYDHVILPRKAFGSHQTLQEKKGVCIEMSYLGCVLFRLQGLKADIALVSVDSKGQAVDHACIGIKMKNKTIQLVDPAYHRIHAVHKQWWICKDDDIVNRYQNGYVTSPKLHPKINGALKFLHQVLN